MKPLVVGALIATCTAAPVWGESGDGSPHWRLTAAPMVSQTRSGDDPEVVSGSLSLERTQGRHSFGISIGTADGDALSPELLDSASSSSTNGSVWWGVAWDRLSFQLAVGLSAQTLDGTAIAGASAPPALVGREIRVSEDVDTSSVSATLSRAYGDRIIATPSLSVGYARTSISLATGGQSLGQGQSVGQGLTAEEESEGVTVSLAIDLSGPVNDSLGWSIGGSMVATQDQAARVLTTGGRTNLRPQSRQDEGAAEWVEAYGGLSLAVSETLSIGATAGSTFGLDQEEAWASLSATLAF